MSDDKLKKLMEEKYKEAIEVEKDKKADEVSEKEESTIVYVPYTDPKDRKNYLLKLTMDVVVVDGELFTDKCSAKIENGSDLDQKVIALRHPTDQENLKFYYLKNRKIGGPDENK